MVQDQDYVTYHISESYEYDLSLSWNALLVLTVVTGWPDSQRAATNLWANVIGWPSKQSMSRAGKTSFAIVAAVFRVNGKRALQIPWTRTASAQRKMGRGVATIQYRPHPLYLGWLSQNGWRNEECWRAQWDRISDWAPGLGAKLASLSLCIGCKRQFGEKCVRYIRIRGCANGWWWDEHWRRQIHFESLLRNTWVGGDLLSN